MNWFKKLWNYLEGRNLDDLDPTQENLDELRRLQFHYKAKYLQVKDYAEKIEKELYKDMKK